MKSLMLVFATVGLVTLFSACSPEDDVQPVEQQKVESFDVKSTDDGYIKPTGK